MRSRLLGAVVTAVSVLVLGVQVPAEAATCSYTLNSDGFPVWAAGCPTEVSPGKFGPLRMGRTTVATAKRKQYLAYNEFCSRWDGVAAHSDWRRKNGRIIAWLGGATTTKKLRPSDNLSKARQWYPNLKRTGFMANAYVAGQGWRIYSTKTKSGWLDLYRYNAGDYNFFAVRAKSVRKPIKSWSQDGC